MRIQPTVPNAEGRRASEREAPQVAPRLRASASVITHLLDPRTQPEADSWLGQNCGGHRLTPVADHFRLFVCFDCCTASTPPTRHSLVPTYYSIAGFPSGVFQNRSNKQLFPATTSGEHLTIPSRSLPAIGMPLPLGRTRNDLKAIRMRQMTESWRRRSRCFSYVELKTPRREVEAHTHNQHQGDP